MHHIAEYLVDPNKRVSARRTGSRLLACIGIVVLMTSCDTRKHSLSDPVNHFFCYSFALCPEQPVGTRFGIIGDSWSNLIGGIPALRTFLESKYGYRLTGFTVASLQIQHVLRNSFHYSLIDRAGPDLHYMILSLGGNDLLYNYPPYSANLAADRKILFDQIKRDLLTLVRTGNSYKKMKWGGKDLIWFIHGYDYGDPFNALSNVGLVDGCAVHIATYGYPQSIIQKEVITNLDLLNEAMRSAALEEPSLHYIDLRGTLGGPPGKRGLLLDCIHPNMIGFEFLTDRFVRQMQLITGNEK